MPVVIVLLVLLMLSRANRRVDRLAERTLELVEHAERHLGPEQPPQKQP